MTVDDRDLIERFVAGDRRAFDDLMRSHEDRVFSICLRLMGNREAALDATQETFITLFRKADRYHGSSSFRTWLYRVTVNTCYDQLRKAKRRRTQPLPEHHDPPDTSTDAEFAAVELRPDLMEALQSIPQDFRSAVVLMDVEGFAVSEAASILDVPPGTVKSRVFRGRRLLADNLRNPDMAAERPNGDADA